MALEVLSCQWALEGQHLPLSLSCQGGQASLGLPCLLWLLDHQACLLDLEVPQANPFLLFLLLDQEFHRVLDFLSHPLVQDFLGLLEGLEGLLFLESQGSLSFLEIPNHQQDQAVLDGQDFRDSQELPQVQQAPNVQVRQVALFRLSLPCHLAILDLPLIPVVLALNLLSNLALPYLLGDQEYLEGLVFHLDLGTPQFPSFL